MFYPELKGVALNAYNKMVEKLKFRAMKELGLGQDQLVLRPLRADDLGFSNPEWYFNPMVATSWNAIISSVTIADNRFIGIYGVYNNEDAGDASQIKVTRAGADTRYWHIQQIEGWQSNVGFADDPFTIDQNTIANIQLYARAASTLTEFQLLGVVVEKKGLLINPSGGVRI